jgi:SAM-dependent methyltransferase
MTVLEPEKLAAIECWTADPCGFVEGEPGTRNYAKALVAMRRRYASWLDESLDYAGAAGLDVLDLGSGQGIDLIRFAEAGARVIGIDLTPRHVELARAHLACLELQGAVFEGDVEHLPFPDSSFDRVSSNGVLHHTPDIRAALAEAHRVLRPDGELRVVLYNGRSLHYWLAQVVGQGILKGGLLREHSMAGVLSAGVERSSIGARPLVRVHTAGQVRQLLQGAGFVNVKTSVRHFHWHDIPYGALVQRAPGLRSRALQDTIGRAAGWFVVGIGRRT